MRPQTTDHRPETRDQRHKTKDSRLQTKDQRHKTKDPEGKKKGTFLLFLSFFGLRSSVLGLRSSLQSDIERIVVVPIGFLCDNAEVLYDLDIEARGEAEGLGLAYARVPIVLSHPEIVRMFAELIVGQVKSEELRVKNGFEKIKN